MVQDQFLEVIDRDEAERRFHAVLDLRPVGVETVPLDRCLGRILAEDVSAPVDVPAFDRSNVDGFAVRAEDTFGAEETQPVRLRLNREQLATGATPQTEVRPGTATAIATGAVVPRGADAVVMVEFTECVGAEVLIRRPVAPGGNLTFAGTDIGRGETVLRRGDPLTSRETGVLAALGLGQVTVFRRPQVAILSTGTELTSPGSELPPAHIYDSNATILADAVRELGGMPVPFGIVADDLDALKKTIAQALVHDVVILSGGTSKGAGDLSYQAIAGLGPPGIVVHGVALKPGKPVCLAAVGTKPVVILPGFPTSAIFTFHEFVAPVIRRLAGRRPEPPEQVWARLPVRINSERGRTEYVLVGLVGSEQGSKGEPDSSARTIAAYPMGKGSGSVTTFSRADGFLTIARQREYLEAGEVVPVTLLGRGLQPADLVVIGSHCIWLDFLLGRLQEQGWTTKFMAVGSTGGLTAVQRGECDLAGIHLFDPQTQTYNRPFLDANMVLIPGYARMQGIVYRRGDERFEGRSLDEALRLALSDPTCVMVNRNRGSGTRVLIDQLLGRHRPPGYTVEPKSHNAVAAAVAQRRADWGVCIETVARQLDLGFLPLRQEEFDLVAPRSRADRPAVRAFRRLLADAEVRQSLQAMGFRPKPVDDLEQSR